MYNVCKKIIETQASEILKEALYDAVVQENVILIENSDMYRGLGKTTLIKNLSNYLNICVYTGRSNPLYNKEKIVRKIDDLRRRRKNSWILLDCDVNSEEEGIALIKEIRGMGLTPIGFINVLNEWDSYIRLK